MRFCKFCKCNFLQTGGSKGGPPGWQEELRVPVGTAQTSKNNEKHSYFPNLNETFLFMTGVCQDQGAACVWEHGADKEAGRSWRVQDSGHNHFYATFLWNGRKHFVSPPLLRENSFSFLQLKLFFKHCIWYCFFELSFTPQTPLLCLNWPLDLCTCRGSSWCPSLRARRGARPKWSRTTRGSWRCRRRSTSWRRTGDSNCTTKGFLNISLFSFIFCRLKKDMMAKLESVAAEFR